MVWIGLMSLPTLCPYGGRTLNGAGYLRRSWSDTYKSGVFFHLLGCFHSVLFFVANGVAEKGVANVALPLLATYSLLSGYP